MCCGVQRKARPVHCPSTGAALFWAKASAYFDLEQFALPLIRPDGQLRRDLGKASVRRVDCCLVQILCVDGCLEHNGQIVANIDVDPA
jgi:hypothetical protein